MQDATDAHRQMSRTPPSRSAGRAQANLKTLFRDICPRFIEGPIAT